MQDGENGRQTADGRRQMADGRWQTADGRRQMADGRWQSIVPGGVIRSRPRALRDHHASRTPDNPQIFTIRLFCLPVGV